MKTRTEIATELRDEIKNADSRSYLGKYSDKDILISQAKALQNEWELTLREVTEFTGDMNKTCRDIKEALKIIGEVV